MSIVEADVVFRKSQRMTDFPDGGGLMSTATVVDGVDNNLFDDITDLHRLFGHLSLRKVYGAVLSNNSDTYISAHALVDVPPSDAATDCFVFATGGLSTERAAAVAALESWHRLPATVFPTTVTATSGSNQVVCPSSPLTAPSFPATNTRVGVVPVADVGNPNATTRAVVLAVGSEYGIPNGSGGTDLVRNITLDRAVPFTGSATLYRGIAALTEVRPYGVATTPGSTSAGSTITVDTLHAQVVPYSGSGAYPTTNQGIDPEPFAYANGQVQVLRPNDPVLVASTIAMAPAAVSNGSTTTTGRINLSRLRVIGNNGVVHASFVLNQAAPIGVGCTADLAAGTVSFTDVSGMSQPVTVEHRIEEMSVIASISTLTLTLTRALSRDYPAGTRVSSLLMLGDLQARVGVAFAQQAWTGVFSDTVLGGSPAADYNIAANPIAVTNQGAVNERWYVQFTNTTTFTLVGEQLGVIGTFGTGSACAPINPATGVPYFSIAAVGWGSGWAAGNIYRFNTSGANAPIWVGRSVAPSTPSGDDSVTLQLRGYTNA